MPNIYIVLYIFLSKGFHKALLGKIIKSNLKKFANTYISAVLSSVGHRHIIFFLFIYLWSTISGFPSSSQRRKSLLVNWMALRAGWKHLIRSCRLIESWISARLLNVRTRLNLTTKDPYAKEVRNHV